MKKRFFPIIIGVTLFLAFSITLFAAGRQFLIENPGGSYKVVFRKGREMEQWVGNVEITVITGGDIKDTVIKADVVEIYADERKKAYCKRDVYVIDKKNEVVMTGGEAEYYDSLKYARITKSPFLYIKRDQISIEAEEMERFMDRKMSLAKGNAVVHTKTMTAYGIFVTFNENNKEIILTGRPKLIKDNDVFYADRITLYTENDMVRMEGNVRGELSQMR